MYKLSAFRGQSISLYPAHAPRTVPCSALNKSPALSHALKMIAGRQPALESPTFSLLAAAPPRTDTNRSERGQARPAAAQGKSNIFAFGRGFPLSGSTKQCSSTASMAVPKLVKITRYCTLRIIPLHYQIPAWRTPCCHSVVFRVTGIPPIFISHLRLHIQNCSVLFPPIMNR